MVAVVGHHNGRQGGQVGVEVVNVRNGLLGRQPARAHEAELCPRLEGLVEGGFVRRVGQHGGLWLRLRRRRWQWQRLCDGRVDVIGRGARVAPHVRRGDLGAACEVGPRGAAHDGALHAGAAAGAVVHLHVDVARGLEQQVQGVVAAVDLGLLQRRHRLVVHLDVLLAMLHGRHRRRRRRPPQRFVAADRASRRQRLRDIDGAVGGGDFGRLNLAGARSLARIAHLVVVHLVHLVLAVLLPLAARRGEEALLALAAAAHTRRVVRVVDGPQVAAHLAAATRYACLVSARVRLALPLPLPLPWAWRRCVG